MMSVGDGNQVDMVMETVRGHPPHPIPTMKPDNHVSAPAPTSILTRYIPPHRQVHFKNSIVA